MPDYKLRIIVNGEDRASKTFEDVGSSLDDFGDKVKGIGAGLSVGLTAPLVALGAAAINAGTQLNAGLANIASLGIAESRVLELKANVQDMAIEFGKSTNEMVDGAYQIISTFGDTADTALLLEISTKAAAAGLATVTDAILLGGAVTKAYDDTSVEAYQHVQDLAFQAVNLGVTTFPELASSMGKVIPLTAALGVSMEDTFAVMATATGVTGNTAEVTTQLRGIMQALMDPTKATTELFKAMGIESGKAAIEQLGLQGSIELLTAAAEATGLPISEFISSIEGQTLAVQLANGSQEQFTKNLAAMQNVAGATDAAFKAQTTGINALGFQFQQAKSKLQVFLQTISDAMGPALLAFANAVTPLGDKIQALALKFAAMDPATQTWIVGIAAAAAAVGPLLIGIGYILPALGMMGTALGLLLSPLGLVAAAIGAAFYFDVGGIQTGFSSVVTSAQNMATSVWEALQPLINGEISLGDFAANLKTSIDTAIANFDWSASMATLQTTVTGAIDAIDWTGMADTANGLRDGVLTGMTDSINGVDWSGLSLDFAGMIDSVTESINSIDWSSISLADMGAALATIVAPALTAAIAGMQWVTSSENWSGLVTAVQNAVTSIEWGEIGTSLAGLVTAVTDGIASMDWSAISTPLDNLKTTVTDTFSDMDWSTISTGFVTTMNGWRDSLLESLTTAFTGLDLTTNISGLLTSLTTAITDINWDSLGTSLGEAVKLVLSPEGLKATFATAVAAIAPALTTAIGAITWVMSSENFSGLATSITTAIGEINWNTVSEKLSTLKTAISDGWTEFTGGFMEAAGIEAPDWAAILVWPDIDWPGWATWISFPTIDWPGWSTWIKFPSIPDFPGWSAIFNSAKAGVTDLLGIGGESTGTPSFGGGWTWVGERGPELLNLPRGAQVLSNQQSMGMIGQLAGGTGGLSAGQQAGFNAFVAAQGQKEADKAAKELKKSVDKMGKTIDKSIDDMAQKLGSILQSIPGLFGTSSVTADQMKMGELGIPQNFADDYLRRLTDEVINGVDWEGVDIGDAAARAGIDPSLPHEAILEMFKAAWGDSSLFANAANLDLINQEAVQEGIDKANAQAAGKANIMALFGIAPDEATAQAVTLGTSLHTGIQQGITQGAAGGAGLGTSLVSGMASDITPESMAPVASAIATGLTTNLDSEDVSFGTALESVINKQLEGEGLFSGTAGMILEKIAGYFTDQEFGIDLISNFASIWVNQLGVQSAIDHLLDVGARIAEIVFKGYQAKSEELDWTGAVTAASLAQTSAATTPTDTTTLPLPDTLGKGLFGGVRQAATNAAATVINVYATVNNQQDINQLAYQVASIQNRRR